MNTSENTGTVFANVRSKLSHFNPSDFFSHLGLTKRKTSSSNSNQKLLPNNVLVGNDSNLSKNQVIPVSYRQNQNGTLVESRRTNLRAASPPSPILPIKNAASSDLHENHNEKLMDVSLTPPGVVEEDVDNPFCHDDLWLESDEQNYMDTLELQHFGAIDGLIPTGKHEPGIGHEFHVAQLVNSTFCDKCGDIIWGLYKQAVRCQNCQYTCHYKCRVLVTLDCRSVSDSLKSSSTRSTELPDFGDEESILTDDAIDVSELPEDDVEVVEKIETDIVTDNSINDNLPRGNALMQIIDEYNKFAEGLRMTLDENNVSFRGFLQIHMNFTRPINIVAGDRPPSIYDVLNPDETLTSEDRRRTITSFFLPRNTVKILHITSETTTREMIVSLLKKFKVADNPRKFALYERDLEPGKTLQARLRRFSDDACPLRIALSWGSRSNKRFVLQENDTGDIIWDFFGITELHNFMKILDREEQQYVWQIKQKYDAYRFYLQLELNERGVPTQYATIDDAPAFVRQSSNNFFNNDTSGEDSEVDDGGKVTPKADDATLLSDFKTALSSSCHNTL